MVRKNEADPLAHEIKGEELVSGMTTFIRTVDPEGNVKFTPDLILTKRIIETGACIGGVHFEATSVKRGGNQLVCYWSGAKVWVKEND
jgi:hypothetical protein